MTLYFAYGSNINRAAMARRCPGARAIGQARLAGYKFFVGIDGWGSVKPQPGRSVHGVLWRLTPRDIAALHAYELLHQGLYDVRHLPVRSARAPRGHDLPVAPPRARKTESRLYRDDRSPAAAGNFPSAISFGRALVDSRLTGPRVIDAGELA